MDCLYAMLIHGRLLLFAVSGDYLVFVYFMRTNLMGMFVSPYEEFQMVRFVYVWCTVWINHCVLLGNKCRHN
ncbi:hypothetical protein Smp_113200 [Schistosoma mansoni]|uniref:hypothetical protein n=1 Tax=Schistosoma mansoni TaxID=6183 RepID=UPI00022DC7E7|nr:hypothetical protein Smp_113200 [Schistosoma mansoni]|eukprot:XP_018649976.1 hypothetical protein Smp_113200 [Schistosoma mansoni]